ncbi:MULTISPECIES: nucleotidyltransferase domain-containing protein [Streptomyces]|uniref:Polymerase nucleotidyl transferase domain-containing protein n=2 Tax=Streptomyces TaxID=1883 RepID=A0ABP9CY81_9ACTN|nr:MULTISPECIES: nucleotidyltransferase domain-containing protein [Streptomyces]MEB8342125.1 nucleotidyltransferase domain-containing protein [Streptomyces endophyticus]
MKRERATTLLNDMLDRMEEGGWPLDLVDEVLVFGSYARGALNPSDVDLVVEHRRDDRLTSEFLHSLSYGGDPSASMKRALKGRSRGLQIHFGERKSLEAEGFELTLLWTRGEPVDAARARLAAITPDPEAGRAPRDHMIEAFDGIDRWVPRPVRIDLTDLVDRKAATIRQLQLPDAEPAHPAALEALTRWSETSPLRRAAAAVLAHLEATSRPLDSVYLHGEPVIGSRYSDTTWQTGIGFGWSHYRSISHHLQEGTDWFEVVRPTRTQPLHALHITVQDRSALPRP